MVSYRAILMLLRTERQGAACQAFTSIEQSGNSKNFRATASVRRLGTRKRR